MGLHEFIADASISVFGALGALVVLQNLPRIIASEAVASRFRFCLWVLVALLPARVGHWGELGWLFSVVTNAGAALLPLAALLIAEGLLRRHAPRWLKWYCAGGALIFAAMACMTFGALGFWQVFGLLLFQVSGLAAVTAFVLFRDRASLAPAENLAIGRIALSLLLILPFLVSDFMRTPTYDIPVRLGGVAVLALCWLSISFQRPGLGKLDILGGFTAVILVSAALTSLLALAIDLDARGAAQICAVLVAALLLLATWQASVALYIEDGQLVALRAMSSASDTGPEAGFAFLRQAAGAPDAVIVEEEKLGDLDAAALRAAFEHAPVHKIDETTEDVAWLLASYNATHAVMLTETPVRIAVMNTPELSTADAEGASLKAVARMAAMMSRKT